MKIDLTGKTALVTGGNIGIGGAIALALARCGAAVAITYFQGDLEQTKVMEALGCKTPAFYLDATDSTQVNQVIAAAAGALGGRIDILINNVGGLVGRVPVQEMTDEFWHRVLDVNLSSSFYCIRAASQYMPECGRIVNLASLAAHDGGGNGAVAYTSAKAGVIGLTRSLAKELAPRQIRVNALAPGFIAGTTFHNTFTAESVQKMIVEKTPLKRGGTAEDVAAAALFLVSDLADFITGEVLEVNGGLWFA
jgi:3-oxoacyl-[acyl-carrier protein] reductase